MSILETIFVILKKFLKMAKNLGCYSWYQSHSLSELGFDHSTPRLKPCMLEMNYHKITKGLKVLHALEYALLLP